MKCSSVREKFFDYIDGAIEGSDLREFEDHVNRCPECRRELENVRQLDARLQKEIPAYVESIEPSAAFLNRLRHLDLEPTSNRTSGFWDSLLSVFQEHRMAFGTGLAVLLVIALGLAIPTLTQNGKDNDTQMIAEATPTDSREHSAIQAPSEEAIIMDKSSDDVNKTTGSGVSAPAPLVTPTTEPPSEGSQHTFTWNESEGAPTPADEPAPMPEPVPLPAPTPTPTSQPPMIADVGEPDQESGGSADVSLGADQEPMEDPATIIAMNDDEVMAIIEGPFHMEVRYDVTEKDYMCDGPTVVITLDEKDPPENHIYVCVDLENEQVVDIHICGN